MYPELLTSKIHSNLEIVVSAAGTRKASWLFYSRFHILIKPFSFLCVTVSLQGQNLQVGHITEVLKKVAFHTHDGEQDVDAGWGKQELGQSTNQLPKTNYKEDINTR